MDKYANRRLRLQQLIDSQFGGNKARFAEKVDRAPDYISRCLSTKAHGKRIGEDFAGHIESTLGLRTGWFDRPADEPSGTIAVDVTIREELILELIRSLTAEQQEIFLTEMRNTRDANMVTQRVMGEKLKKTISNAKMEETYGLPTDKSPKIVTAEDNHPRGRPPPKKGST